MAEENITLLDFLISQAKAYDQPQSTLSAQRFLLAVLDYCAGVTERIPSEAQKCAFQCLLEDYLPRSSDDYSPQRAYLRERIEAGDDGVGYVEDMYMKRLLYKAKELAGEQKDPELETLTLLQLMLEEPSETVAAFRAHCAEGAAPEEQPQAKDQKRADALNALLQQLNRRNEKQQTPDERADADAEEDFDDLPAGNDLPERAAANISRRDPKKALSELTAQVKDLHRKLSETVLGQENAISVFTMGFFQAELARIMHTKRRKPRATFLFAGPPGVGKTFLAETAAELLGLPHQRFDMSEYCDKESALELIGSDSVFKGSKEGNLTAYIKQHRRCVLLFDEIEKAHITIIHLFLQILDAGRIRDSNSDRELSFEDAIIIFTTNAGRQLYENSDLTDFSGISRRVVLNALQNDKDPRTGNPFFPAAICSRFASGNVVMLNHMRASDLRRIAKSRVLQQAESFQDMFNIDLRIDEQVYTALLFAEGGAVDARIVSSRAESFLSGELFELFRLLGKQAGGADISQLESIEVNLSLPQDNADILKLFTNAEAPAVLTVGGAALAEQCRQGCGAAEFISAPDAETVRSCLRTRNIDFALVDLSYGRTQTRTYLNAEDAESVGRALFWQIKTEFPAIPIFLLQRQQAELSDEEIVSFLSLGVCGILKEPGDAAFADAVKDAAEMLYQQKNMDELTKANRLVSFETSQTLCDDGKRAVIELFDFEMAVAVDAEDSKNVLSSLSKPNVSFDEIIGAEEAKKELDYFVDYLKNPKSYIGTGVSAPKGVLMYGPPGTGKTLLAKATASASDVTFIAAEGNQFLKKYVGEGPDSVRELFRTARKYAPSILFIDEIDSIAKNRGDAMESHDDVLTAFLTEMDGFKTDPTRPVFVLAATNYDVEQGGGRSLDPALLRRFDRRILVDLPNRDGRIQYIRQRMAKNPALVLSDEEVDNVAIRSTGMSLADLASVFELALRSAIRDGDRKVTDEIFEEAFETFNAGETKKWDIAQLERVARHEAGHAFLCWQSGETPSYLTVVARGGHGGYMQHADNEGKMIDTRRELLARVRTSLGGRAAEIVYYGEEDGVSTGASGDLHNATAIAQRLLCNYGMDASFGLAYIEQPQSGELSAAVLASVNRILDEQMQSAVREIAANRAAIDALVGELLVKNHMSGDEIDRVLTAAGAVR